MTQQKRALEQQSPTILAPGTKFREDDFSADPGQGWWVPWNTSS